MAKRSPIFDRPPPTNTPIPEPRMICGRCGNVGMTLVVLDEGAPGIRSASNPRGREVLLCNAACSSLTEARHG